MICWRRKLSIAVPPTQILKRLEHENVIRLVEIVTSKSNQAIQTGKGSIYLVFEYVIQALSLCARTREPCAVCVLSFCRPPC